VKAAIPAKIRQTRQFDSNLNQSRRQSFMALKESQRKVRLMIDALYTATAGLAASANRFDKAAQNVIKASTPVTAKADAKPSGDDLPAAIVDSKTSEISFKANATVIKTADKMLGTLLDTIA
jgi:hypothetical protein